jgi:hypothetical protein
LSWILAYPFKNGIATLDSKSDGLASQEFYGDLHATAETKHQLEPAMSLRLRAHFLRRIGLVYQEGAFLVQDLCPYVFNGTFLDVKSDGLADQGLYKDLHTKQTRSRRINHRFSLPESIRSRAQYLRR